MNDKKILDILNGVNGKKSSNLDLLQNTLEGLLNVVNPWMNKTFPNEMLMCKRLDYYDKLLVVVGSKYYNDDKMTVFSCSIISKNVVFDCPFWEQHLVKYSSKKVKFDDGFAEKVAAMFKQLFSDDQFVSKLNIYEDLFVKKQTFEMTFFYSDYLFYSPESLYLNLPKEKLLQLLYNKNIELKLNKKICTHHQFSLNDYVKKYGEVNGFKCEFVSLKKDVATIKLV